MKTDLLDCSGSTKLLDNEEELGSVLGIKTNIPNTVSVLGILFHKKNSYGIRDVISIIQNGIRDIIPGPRWNLDLYLAVGANVFL